ncbi:MAG: hypothetical protein JXB48_15740 [Candidatus Latescibacteria bacterium]|nr:hypothetical protein [Candidatus Latescibacterota bacterium]
MDFSNIKPISIHDRKHKVNITHCGSVPTDDSFTGFYDSLPKVLGVDNLKTAAQAIANASGESREVILAMGAHPIKCGLSPVIIDLMKQGIITCIAMNGAGSIHDFEMAYIGETSEDVAQTLQDGSFGMVEETGQILNEAMAAGVKDGLGAGASVGRMISKTNYEHADISIQAAGYRLGIDVTVHIAVGTDTIHVHPSADGAVIGKASFTDMKTFTGHIARLEGGVFINLGSAVILPEVFLKALSAVRNMGYEVLHFTTVNMDMISHYRPSENVLKRPGLTGAKAINLVGHHEIMLPLLASAVRIEKERL